MIIDIDIKVDNKHIISISVEDKEDLLKTEQALSKLVKQIRDIREQVGV